MSKLINELMQFRLSILLTSLLLLTACDVMLSESVVADRSQNAQVACADRLAAGDLTGAQRECLILLNILEAGFRG